MNSDLASGKRSEPGSIEDRLAQAPPERYVLRLFVAGTAPSSVQAIARLHAVCDEHLEGRYDLEIVDVHQQPSRAADDDIFAIPTLLKELPAPLRRIIGDLSDEGRVLIALGIEPGRTVPDK